MPEEKVATEGEAVAVQTAPVTSGVFHIEMRCNGRLAPLKRGRMLEYYQLKQIKNEPNPTNSTDNFCFYRGYII
jgi:hypothetical protein